MKKLFSAIILFSFLILIGTAFSGDFNPTVMTVTGSTRIGYAFDGRDLSIPFTLTGTPGAVWLVINTRDLASNINNVRNGYLGWHYVNNIDTTIYISQRYTKDQGNNVIIWDGKNENGNLAYPSDYDYYLWAYDDKTPRKMACSFMQIGFGWDSQFTTIIEKGEDGKPLSNPILFGARPWYNCQPDPSQPDYAYKAHGTVQKWVLGLDPYNDSLIQTTRMSIFDDAVTNFTYGGPVLDPTDYNIFYNINRNFVQKVSTINKWDFVTGGKAVMDLEWGTWDNVTLEDLGVMNGKWSQQPSLFTDGNFIYQVSPGLNRKDEEWNKFRVYDWDGNVVMDKMMHEWYMPNDPNPDKFINGAFHHMYSRTPYNWFLLSHSSCIHEMIDTSRLVQDADDESDMFMFQNSNGDYFLDTAYNSGIEPAWYCLSENKEVTMRRESIAIDRNGFNVIGVSYLGLASFAVSTQDGTGMGYMQFADDTVGDDKNIKGGGLLVDNGSAFDGLYFNSPLLADTPNFESIQQTNFVASDSFRGMISYGYSTGGYFVVSAPNGGEKLVPGSEYAIKWGSSNMSQKVKIEYSINKGSTWNTIAEISDTTGTYLWKVPDVMSSNCLIKISGDTSDNYFSIGNTLIVISPNGGEKYHPGEIKDIRWIGDGVVNVRIEYSMDNGSSWRVITESTESDGVFQWSLPDTMSAFCLIKITDTEYNAVTDTSNLAFMILETSVKIVSPNGGEEYKAGQICPIRWYYYDASYINIEISYNNGATWSLIAKKVPAKQGVYSWTVTGMPSDKCLIKISDSWDPTISDTSDGLFWIIPSFPYNYTSYIIMTSPKGGEVILRGSSSPIIWFSKNVEKVKIEYSLDNGASWNPIAGSVDAALKSYDWTLPPTASKTCKIRISDASNLSVKDENDALFTISDPFVHLIYPNGTEKWGIGSTKTIRWQSLGVEKVKIEYSIDDGLNWIESITADSSPDSVRWTVPSVESVYCRMRISDKSYPGISDSTVNSFIILKAYIISNNPKGGVTLPAGSHTWITWQCAGIEGLKIEYSINDGLEWKVITNDVNPNVGMFGWNVPVVESYLGRIRLSDKDNALTFFINELPFSIKSKISDVKAELPKEFTVFQNTPNPFNPSTTIIFALPKPNLVKAEIYNLAGQRVASLTDNYMEAGRHTLTWNAAGFSAGVYFCRVAHGTMTRTIKMTLVK